MSLRYSEGSAIRFDDKTVLLRGPWGPSQVSSNYVTQFYK
jgi:hypothetical protein